MPTIFEDDPAAPPSHPLTPALLGRLEDLLNRVDLLPMVERRPVVSLAPGRPPQLVLSEINVAPETVRRRLIPDADLAADPWLLRRLRATLDTQLMELLAKGRLDIGPLPFGIDTPVAAVGGPAFAAFDGWLRQSARADALIDLHLMDVFADFPAYLRARDRLHALGYRLCLDGVTADALPFVDRAALGFDIVKVVWSPSLASELTAAGNSRLKDLADQNGRGRIVLTEIDSDLGVRHAHAVGVTLFQGPWVETALTAAPSAA
jgi:hypothetical protein